MTAWEPWKREYEHGVFLLLPPSAVADLVDQLRHRYDPRSAAICDAHITLSEPLRAPLTSRQHDELAALLAGIAPIEFHYGPITDMGHPPGVVFAITPTEPFFELRRSVHATSAFEGHPLLRADHQPHMTVAEFITIEQTAELLGELGNLAPGKFLCDSIVLMAPDSKYHFSPVLSIPMLATR
jgi:2'-5' RNA ligase